MQKPAYDVFLALVSLAAYFRRGYIIVRQAKLLERVGATTGRRMARRTLNRHLAALERLRIINRTQRHRRDPKTREFKPRATLYTFAELGILWIKTMRSAAAIPLGRLRVPKMAHSQKPYLSKEERAVHKPRTAPNRRPRYAGARNGPR